MHLDVAFAGTFFSSASDVCSSCLPTNPLFSDIPDIPIQNRNMAARIIPLVKGLKIRFRFLQDQRGVDDEAMMDTPVMGSAIGLPN